jgi:uncharacterized membrane protein YqgA involved in biofilm formation
MLHIFIFLLHLQIEIKYFVLKFIFMIGTLVNAAAVVVGGTVGMLLNKSMPERFKTIYFQAIGLFTIAIGISMVWNMQNIIMVVGSLAVGSLLGEWMNLEVGVERLANALKKRFKIGSEKFSEGLITSFLLFCVGAMTIVGAIDEGTGRSNEVLLTKSMMDGFSAILLASAFGIGVIVSAIPLLIFQGGITLLAMSAASFFTPEIIQGLTSIGGILLIGLGMNILEIKKIRIVNMLPALVVVIIVIWIYNAL